MSLPTYVPKDTVSERLPLIFPEGTPNQNYCVRDLSASTVFVMLYINAVEGSNQYLAPIHVYRMGEAQATNRIDEARLDYAGSSSNRKYEYKGASWYADNTRESIRDETLREGLMLVGAVDQIDVPTTSSKPRYFLKASFASLFDPTLTGDALDKAIEEWRKSNLSAGALARTQLVRQGAVATEQGVSVTFPNGETRRLSPGKSSIVSKAVIEEFTKRFLKTPAILWLSESGNKVVNRDDDLAKRIGLNIEADKNLPDLILLDIGYDDPILIFVEVVATDGPVSERRKKALYELTDEAGFSRDHVTFITAFIDRNNAAFKKAIPNLAWGTFAWFASEPDQLIVLSNEGPHSIQHLHAWLQK